MYQFKPLSKAKLVSSSTVTDYNTHVTSTLSFQNVSFSIPRCLTAMWESCCTSVQKQKTFSPELCELLQSADFCHQSWRKSL